VAGASSPAPPAIHHCSDFAGGLTFGGATFGGISFGGANCSSRLAGVLSASFGTSRLCISKTRPQDLQRTVWKLSGSSQNTGSSSGSGGPPKSLRETTSSSGCSPNRHRKRRNVPLILSTPLLVIASTQAVIGLRSIMLVVIALLLLALGVHRYQACQKKGGKYSTVGAGGAEHSFDCRPLDERRKTDGASVAALFLIQLDHSQLAFAQWPIPHSTAEHDAAAQMIDTFVVRLHRSQSITKVFSRAPHALPVGVLEPSSALEHLRCP
jgi:hypothetical protein